ncbi:putative nuclease HARBI1 [Diabrotica virgifera virgifera]|uniref:Nuclease HARBI1 n=1 Tax=Diabrotica virgifera virgifera TaxID=50390 RepID=A0A6P7HHI1_DIAVI|nr:putative nuclease HARBI1 [Diabrotica virgifera virgifera]XP_050517939.1 putative nuclease HARBI1 [Diabrotica virgifera virgifera]
MHDAAIWNMSNASIHMEETYNNNERGFWLLGDSGYPLQPWLLTPVEGAQEGTPEGRYTSAHIHVRNTIERCHCCFESTFPLPFKAPSTTLMSSYSDSYYKFLLCFTQYPYCP